MTFKFPELVFEFCSRSDLQYTKFRDEHYVDNRGARGQQAHFLIWYKGTLAGVISGGSAALAVAARDAFLLLTLRRRRRQSVPAMRFPDTRREKAEVLIPLFGGRSIG